MGDARGCRDHPAGPSTGIGATSRMPSIAAPRVQGTAPRGRTPSASTACGRKIATRGSSISARPSPVAARAGCRGGSVPRLRISRAAARQRQQQPHDMRPVARRRAILRPLPAARRSGRSRPRPAPPSAAPQAGRDTPASTAIQKVATHSPSVIPAPASARRSWPAPAAARPPARPPAQPSRRSRPRRPRCRAAAARSPRVSAYHASTAKDCAASSSTRRARMPGVPLDMRGAAYYAGRLQP